MGPDPLKKEFQKEGTHSWYCIVLEFSSVSQLSSGTTANARRPAGMTTDGLVP